MHMPPCNIFPSLYKIQDGTKKIAFFPAVAEPTLCSTNFRLLLCERTRGHGAGPGEKVNGPPLPGRHAYFWLILHAKLLIACIHEVE